MANTKIITPDIIDLPAVNNTDGIILPKGPTNPISADFLVVAGGGGGGGSDISHTAGAGGGAGGLRTSWAGGSGGGASSEASLSLAFSTQYTITVGTGGSVGTQTSNGGNGSDSVFASITSVGGGGGGSAWASATSTLTIGGSGGGAQYYASQTPGSGTTNQGNAGGGAGPGSSAGNGAGGGGGAGNGQTGVSGTSTSGGNGGNGLAVSITGTSVTYAGGGGGGQWLWGYGGTVTPGTGGTGGGGNAAGGSGGSGDDGTVNTGGGGGGGSANYTAGPATINGGLGGSGVVVIRVPTGVTATFSGGVTANGSTGGTIAPDTSTGDNIWIVTATTDASQTVEFSGTAIGGRPTSPSTGEFRYNTSTKLIEFYDSTQWVSLSSSPAVPQSGTTTTCNYPTTATALYQFEGNANDTCGNYNATSVTDVTYSSTAPAQFGQYALAGSSPEIVTGITQDSNVPFTWSFWFYATAISGIDNIIAASNQINVGLEFNKIWLFTGGSNRGSGTSVSVNTWTHYAVTFDGSSGFVTYLNGSLAENITQTPPSFTSGDVKLLLNLYGTWGPFEGRFDQLRIFPSVLTATQVNALYTETAP